MANKLNLCAGSAQTGYGIVGWNALKYFDKHNKDWDIYYHTYGESDRGPQAAQFINKFKRKNIFHYDAPCLNIWHQFSLATPVGKGKHFAYVFFELNEFKEHEKHHLNYADEIFVASKWAKETLIRNGVHSDETINVVPLGTDENIISSFDVEKRKPGPTIFLNCGKWEIRKGHDILLEVFNKAFTKDDNVELWRIGSNPYLALQTQKDNFTWERMYRESKLGDKIKIVAWQNDQNSVFNIMNEADCGVFLSRGEAWNLGALDMMGLGKQIIITNNSGHTEFCDEYNSHLVQTDLVEEAFDGTWFHEDTAKECTWSGFSEENIDEAVEHMRSVHEAVQSTDTLLNETGIETAKEYTWENTFNTATKYILK